jgi:D-inositol-3-phosphate glycosyltransferase
MTQIMEGRGYVDCVVRGLRIPDSLITARNPIKRVCPKRKEYVVEEKKVMDKKKILVLGDSPGAACTGFARVITEILKDLYDTGLYDITIVGINYDNQPHTFPYRIIPATSGLNVRYNDMLGRARCLDELAKGDYDIFFTVQDLAVIQTMVDGLTKLREKKTFKTIMYIPIDSNMDTKPAWVTDVLPLLDYPVAYTHYAKKELQKFTTRHDIRVCYHGVNTAEFYECRQDIKRDKVLNDFFPLTTEFTSEAEVNKRCVIINVNRNQTRKDYLRTFQIFAEFKKKYPERNPLLLVIAQIVDQGGDISIIAKQCGLLYGADWVTPKGYSASAGYPTEIVNMWYNCADILFSSTLGEGFGLSSIEGMMCGLPAVFPNNTSLPEILGEGTRGFLVDSGEELADTCTMGVYDSSLVRPRINIEQAVMALDLAANRNNPEVERKRQNALKWAKEMSWRNVNKFWVNLFAEATAD